MRQYILSMAATEPKSSRKTKRQPTRGNDKVKRDERARGDGVSDDGRKSRTKRTARNEPYEITTLEDLQLLDDSQTGTDGNFDFDRPFIVLIHAPWCGFCRDLRTEWDKMASALTKLGMQVVEMDISVVPEGRQRGSRLIQALESRGVPITTVPDITLVVAGKPVRYDDAVIDASAYEAPPREGPRSAIHMMAFVKDGLQGKFSRVEGRGGGGASSERHLTERRRR